MRLLTDVEITQLVIDSALITPFINIKVATETNAATRKTTKVWSYGLEPLGYTFRSSLDGELQTPEETASIESQCKKDENGRTYIWIGSGEYLLLKTVELVKMPADVTILNFTGKSTCEIRQGGKTHSTQVEPGYEGRLTFGVSNPTPNPIKFYLLEGAIQANFIKVDQAPDTLYDGHYQGGNRLHSI